MKQQKYICILDEKLNKCPNYTENSQCSNPSLNCGMLRIEQTNQAKYIRKERWYEKYYK